MNRLANEKSLYLRQHANNPVDWFPWGADALQKAREEDKPILVSIGYSACHWCHVMAHESFEDDYIARLMNKHFVCIKIDREERPDLDQIFMEAVQMMNGHGGWPLNVFCLPDGRPFAGGTYFPPEDRGQNIIPWPQLLMRVADFFQRNRKDLEENADAIIGNISLSNTPPDSEDNNDDISPADLIEAARLICRDHDTGHGGFGSAPKFPPAMALAFLINVRSARAIDEGDEDLARRIDGVVNTTLTAMARGGIFDQLGGGFARYSVDRDWIIPHFEKMLYDNGLLLDAYVKGWLSYRKPIYRSITEETIAWLQREMHNPDGAFCASIDADSEGEEGKYYVWTPSEVEAVLGKEEAEKFCQAYGISEQGNFEHGASNPTVRVTEAEDRDSFADARHKLLQARQQRVPPGKDTKEIVSWNALAIRGLAEAGFWLGRKEWLQMAFKAAESLWVRMRRDGDRLYSVAYGDEARHNGVLDDYAFLAEAYLALAGKVDWLQPGLSAQCLERAITLTESVFAHFADQDGVPGFFFTSDDHEEIPARRKEWFDNAMPSGNSSMANVLVSLYALTGNARYAEHLAGLKKMCAGLASKAPRAVSHLLSALTDQALGVCTIKARDVSLDDLQQALSGRPWRRLFIQHVTDSNQPTGYQLCVGTECLAPTTSATELAEKL